MIHLPFGMMEELEALRKQLNLKDLSAVVITAVAALSEEQDTNDEV